MNPRLMRPLARRQAPAPGPTDPLFSQVAMLLHMDGGDASTTFTDSSASPKSVTAYGDAQISTDESKFGGASGLFDGDGDYLGLGSTPPFTGWGDQDWTVEAWVRPSSVSGYRIVFTAVLRLNIHLLNTGDIYVNDANTGAGGLAISSALITDTWQHLAVVRSGSDTSVFVDGISLGSAEVPYGNGGGAWRLGGDDSQSSYHFGYIDEFRVTLSARYTANFTPPTAAFPNS